MIDGLTPSSIWLLEVAVDCYPNLRLISLSEPSLRLQRLRPGHGLDRDDLVKTLLRLQQQEDITFYRHSADNRVAVVLDETQLRDNLIPPERSTGERDVRFLTDGYSYGLTESGAARWERFAEPDWNRFAFWGYGEEERDYKIIAGSKEYLDELMAHADEVIFDPIVPGSIVEDVLTPWDATYWKQLPHGYRIRCKTNDANQDQAYLVQRIQRSRSKTWADVDRHYELHRWVKRTGIGDLFWRQPGK